MEVAKSDRCSKMTKIGALMFWSRLAKYSSANDSFIDAVVSCGIKDQAIFHVSMLTSGHTIVHATEQNGVVSESLFNYLKRMVKDGCGMRVSIMNVLHQPLPVRQRAVNWAQSKVGCAYNDIFNENCINSKGQEAYYCCQLIRKAYEAAVGVPVFTLHPLNFTNADGFIDPYWKKYFNERNMDVPINECGSHPSRLAASENLEKLCSLAVRNMSEAMQCSERARLLFSDE
ncbi:hypothetical protein D918_00062 [Trichuris suis]|nr:hypothetical protein D918_00062 [Trichuris suis]